MAEIRIRKKKSPVWAWIIALVIIVAAGLLIYNLVFDDRETAEPQASGVETTNTTNNY